jgi:hypothetical protein
VKYPRYTSDVIVQEFHDEHAILTRIGGLTDVRVPWGVKLGVVQTTQWSGTGSPSVEWPVLWQQGPLGTSLVDAVRECRGIDDRVALANRVVGTVLRTLRAVHAADIVHCDVRPANIVMGRNGDAYLVDWGLSCARGTSALRCGVAAYAAPNVFGCRPYDAQPAMDVCGALCTWIAIVHGGAAVEVPWITQPVAAELMSDVRSYWLRQNHTLVGVSKVRELKVLTDSSKRVTDEVYSFCDSFPGAGAGK